MTAIEIVLQMAENGDHEAKEALPDLSGEICDLIQDLRAEVREARRVPPPDKNERDAQELVSLRMRVKAYAAEIPEAVRVRIDQEVNMRLMYPTMFDEDGNRKPPLSMRPEGE